MLEVMNIVFTGGEVQRPKPNVPKSVDVNIKIDGMEPKGADMALVSFTYKVDYLPDSGMVKMTGLAFCRETPDNIKQIMKLYKKKKELPMQYGAKLINMINANAGLNSIFLIRPFNLLPPFMPPKITGEIPAYKNKKTKKTKKKKTKKN